MERFAVCEFTTMDTTFAEDLELAQRFGLRGIGLCEAKLPPGEDSHSLELLEQSGLTVTSTLGAVLSPLPTVPAGLYAALSDPAERVAAMCASIDRLAPFRPDTIVFSTGADVGYTRDEAYEIARNGIRTVARHAAEHGLTISIEPVRDVGFNASFLRTLRETLDFIDAVGEDNVLVCYDVYHLWDDPEALELVPGNAHRIGSVQVNDWHEPPRARGDRLIPGDGVIDLAGILGTLDAAGYTGWYDLEIFSDDGRWGTPVPDSVWAMDPAEVYRRSIAGFTAAWQNRARADKDDE